VQTSGRLFAVALAVAVGVTLAARAQPNAQSTPQQPTFRGDVNVVRVDVVVTDKSDQPVLDLTADDFVVTDEGRQQRVDMFKLISLDGGLMRTPDGPPRVIRTEDDERSEAARDDVRLFAFLLDDYHVKRENAMAVREELARFVATQLAPMDMVCLMTPLQPLASVFLTRNHDAIQRGLLQFTGRKYDYEPVNDAERRYAYRLSPGTIERIRNDVVFGAMEGLILKLGAMKDGRKALILVTEGFLNGLPPSEFSSMEMDVRLKEIFDLANRYNVSIYAVDPRRSTMTEFAMDRNVPMKLDKVYLDYSLRTLRHLADNTNGRAIVGRNDLLQAMKHIVVDSSAYYLLGYTSAGSRPDGKYHQISVKVKRPGVEVRARHGYWALKAEDAARLAAGSAPRLPNPVEMALAENVASPTQLVRTWIGMSRGESGRTRVRIVWEPAPGREASRAAAADVAGLSVAATGKDDAMIFRSRSTSAAPVANRSIAFDAPPGLTHLRLSIEAADGYVLDTELRDIRVPELTAPGALGTPEVFVGRTPAEITRFRSDAQSAPSTRREFSRIERLLLRVPIYGPGGSPPSLTARLLNRTNQPVNPLAVQESRADTALVEVSLASLAPGEYAIELSTSGDADASRELVAFRVTP